MITSNDVTTQAIEWALSGLERRSQVIANNVANSEVPNFRAQRVEFEGQLAAALESGRMDQRLEATVVETGDPAGVNGNNVRMEDEMVDMLETNLMKSAMVQAFNYKAEVLRLAVGRVR
jgi:flagellar basal-body rod protein FlgB